MQHYKPAISSAKEEVIKRAERISAEMHEYANKTFHEDDNDILGYDDCCIQFLVMKIAEMEYRAHLEANTVFINS
jgi:hypothetical protein